MSDNLNIDPETLTAQELIYWQVLEEIKHYNQSLNTPTPLPQPALSKEQILAARMWQAEKLAPLLDEFSRQMQQIRQLPKITDDNSTEKVQCADMDFPLRKQISELFANELTGKGRKVVWRRLYEFYKIADCQFTRDKNKNTYQLQAEYEPALEQYLICLEELASAEKYPVEETDKLNKAGKSTEQILWENRVISEEEYDILDDEMEQEGYVTEENDYLGLKRYALTESLSSTLFSLGATYIRLQYWEGEKQQPDAELIRQWDERGTEVMDVERNPENFQQFAHMRQLINLYNPELLKMFQVEDTLIEAVRKEKGELVWSLWKK
jgi:hypothetical protein